MAIGDIAGGFAAGMSDYISKERERRRKAEDDELEFRKSIIQSFINRPDFNRDPRLLGKALQNLFDIQAAKTNRKLKGGLAGMQGSHELPVSDFFTGIFDATRPLVGPTTEEVPAPPTAMEQGVMPQAGMILPGPKAITNTGEPVAEDKFKQWYADMATKQGLNPNPDDPAQQYDYRAAFASGASPDQSGHWPSQFKMQGHPNLVVGGVDTRTGQAPTGAAGPSNYIPPSPVATSPEAIVEAGKATAAYKKGPKRRPLPEALQPYFRSPEEMAQEEGTAAGIKAGAVETAKNVAERDYLKELGFTDADIRRLEQAKVERYRGGMAAQDITEVWKTPDGRTVRATRMFDPASRSFTQPVDILTGQALPQGSTPMQGQGAGGLMRNTMGFTNPQIRSAYADIQRQWNSHKAVQVSFTVKQQNAIMQDASRQLDDEAKRAGGWMNPASQAILVTFQKILDPLSVVRESEYARSPEGMGLKHRIEGYFDRLKQGGVGMTLEDLRAFAQMAQRIAEIVDINTLPVRAQIEKQIKTIDPDSTFEDVFGTPTGLPDYSGVIPPPPAVQTAPPEERVIPSGPYAGKKATKDATTGKWLLKPGQ
jgi:hypothetical protein